MCENNYNGECTCIQAHCSGYNNPEGYNSQRRFTTLQGSLTDLQNIRITIWNQMNWKNSIYKCLMTVSVKHIVCSATLQSLLNHNGEGCIHLFAPLPFFDNANIASIPNLHEYITYIYNSSTLATRSAKPQLTITKFHHTIQRSTTRPI